MNKIFSRDFWSDFWPKFQTALFTPKYSVRNIILSVAFGFLIGIIVLSIFYGPSAAFALLYSLLRQDFSSIGQGFLMMIDKVAILGFAGLAVLVCMKSGSLNIGVSGQMTFGAFLAYAVLNKISASGPLNPATALILGMLITIAGSTSLAVLAGVLKAFFKVNEVLSTIMLNWVVVYFLRFIVQHFFNSNSDWFIGNTSQDGLLLNKNAQVFTGATESGVLPLAMMGLVLFAFACMILWFVFKKTVFGFKSSVVGKNTCAAEYSGYEVKRSIVLTFAISGVLAGMAGFVSFQLANFQIPAGTQPITQGFLGIVVALVGSVNSLGVFFAGILFGILDGPVGGIVILIPNVYVNSIEIFSASVSYSVAIILMWQYFKPALFIKKWIAKTPLDKWSNRSNSKLVKKEGA